MNIIMIGYRAKGIDKFQTRHIFFDLVNGTNALLQTFATGQNTSDTMGVDPVNDLLAGMVPLDKLPLLEVTMSLRRRPRS